MKLIGLCHLNLNSIIKQFKLKQIDKANEL